MLHESLNRIEGVKVIFQKYSAHFFSFTSTSSTICFLKQCEDMFIQHLISNLAQTMYVPKKHKIFQTPAVLNPN